MSQINLIFVFLITIQLARAQDFKVTAGAGFPDLIHIGGLYELTNSNEVGIQLGTISSINKLLTPTIEHRLYYRKSKKYENLNTGFFGQRLTYSYERSNEYNWHSIFLNLSVGRNYYFTENFGFTWDVGIFFWLMDKQFDNSTGLEVEDDSPPNIPNVLPNLRIQFFRRF